MMSSTCSSVIAGFSINFSSASQTSVRLCGGILVAIPTAMPSAPLIKRFGIEPVKLGLLLRAVEVVGEIDGLLLDIGEHPLGHRG